MHVYQEFQINVNSVFEETEKVLFKKRTMFVRDLTIFACPTDDSRWMPRCDSICSESLIRDGEERMSRALRQLQCFVRLGIISIDLTEIVMRGLGRSQTPGIVQRSRCIQSEQADLLGSSAQLFIGTNYLGQTQELVCADLIEVH